MNMLNYLQRENHFKYYFPIFRLYICFHIIKKIILQWESLSIIYSPSSFWVHTPKLFLPLYTLIQNNYLLFIGYMVILLLLYFFGVGRYFVSVVVYISLKATQDFTGALLNGGDNLLIFVVLYMCFADSYQFFAINKSSSKDKFIRIKNVLSNLAAYSIILHLCLVYFVSALHKVHADVWFNGVANYYILHLDRFSSPFNHYFNNNGYIITISTYFTILFEMYFPVLVWFKYWRNYFIGAGILLHLGIYFFMMIYDFEILFMMIYGFFYTNKEWATFFIYLQNKKTTILNFKYSRQT